MSDRAQQIEQDATDLLVALVAWIERNDMVLTDELRAAFIKLSHTLSDLHLAPPSPASEGLPP